MARGGGGGVIVVTSTAAVPPPEGLPDGVRLLTAKSAPEPDEAWTRGLLSRLAPPGA